MKWTGAWTNATFESPVQFLTSRGGCCPLADNTSEQLGTAPRGGSLYNARPPEPLPPPPLPLP